MKYIHKKCKAELEFKDGNQFGATFKCKKCKKVFVLPTQEQMRYRPELMQSKEYSMIKIE